MLTLGATDRDRPSVLQIADRYPPMYGGAGSQAHQINRRLVEEGWTVDVIAGNHEGGPSTVDGVHVTRLPREPMGEALQKPRGLVSWMLRVVARILRRRESYDLIHSLNAYFPSVAFTLCGGALGTPILIKSSIGNAALAGNRLHQRARIGILRRLTHIVAISTETRKEAEDAGFPKERIHEIPNGVDTERFRPPRDEGLGARREVGVNEEAFVCTYVGAIHRRKGLDDLIEAWASFAADRRGDARLLLVGPIVDTALQEELDAHLASKDVQDTVRFEGYTHDVPTYLRASDVFTLPSHVEGLPNSLLEAMATGLPSISRKIGGVEDLVEPGVSGFLFDEAAPGPASQIRRSLERLYESPKLRREIGREARRTADEEFSLDHVADQYRDLYRAIATNAPPS